MTKVSSFVRKLFRKSSDEEIQCNGLSDDRGLQLRLRKAVKLGKITHVAKLLKQGASPIWTENKEHNRHQFHRSTTYCSLNALLLACRGGDDEVLSLLLDFFYEEPQVLAHFSKAMYSLVIRHNHWKAFHCLHQRRVSISPSSPQCSADSSHSSTSATSTQMLSQVAMESSNSKLPMPIFVAAQHGRHQILAYLLDHYLHGWAHYVFEGHSLLSVAAMNGHYECVRLLLARRIATEQALDAAIALAHCHRQAHVLVLLTSFLSEFGNALEPAFVASCKTVGNSCEVQMGNRDSMAKTVISDFEDDYRRSNDENVSSPINYYNPAEDSSQEKLLHARAQMQHELQRSGMLWFLDGRELMKEIQRHIDPYGVSANDFVVLQSARITANTSLAKEEVVWNAVTSSENTCQHDDLLSSYGDGKSYKSKFSAYKDQEKNAPKDQSRRSEERSILQSAPPSSLLSQSSHSRKLISVRSGKFQQHLLEAIEEHPAGKTEA